MTNEPDKCGACGHEAEIERLTTKLKRSDDDGSRWCAVAYRHEAERDELRETVNRLERLYAHGISGLLGDAGDIPVPYPHEHVALWGALVAYVERLKAGDDASVLNSRAEDAE